MFGQTYFDNIFIDNSKLVSKELRHLYGRDPPYKHPSEVPTLVPELSEL